MKVGFLLIYSGLMVFALMFIVFFVNKDTPNSVFIFLITLYLGFIFIYWRQQNKEAQGPKDVVIGNLEQKKNESKISKFQSQAQSILRSLPKKHDSGYQEEYYLSYSRRLNNPTSLAELRSQVKFHEFSNLEIQNAQTWKNQFKEGEKYFYSTFTVRREGSYQQTLSKLGLKEKYNIDRAEEFVRQFLQDRSKMYFADLSKIVNEINRILGRLFGLKITNVPSVNCRQISMNQFSKLIDFFFRNNHTLPANYKRLVSADNQTQSYYKTRLHSLSQQMKCLAKYEKILQPMYHFPSERFHSCLLINLLRIQFPNEKIGLNSESKTNQNAQRNIFDSYISTFRQNNQFCFIVQLDFWMSLANVPGFRTKSCLEISLVFLLILIKKEASRNHELLKSLQRLLDKRI